MITEFQFFNTEGLFSIVRLLFHDLRVDNDLQPPQWPPKGQIEGPVFLEIYFIKFRKKGGNAFRINIRVAVQRDI